jgi:hypothetical protein
MMRRAIVIIVFSVVFVVSQAFSQAVDTPGTLLAPATPAPLVAPSPTPTVAGPGATLQGTWRVELAVYDYISGLKDMLGQKPEFYHKLVFQGANKGAIVYVGKTEGQEMEYDLRDQGGTLVIAYGSRLKILNDQFQMLYLADGRLFLKSRYLGNMNGKVYYILVRE